jgi:hypothetical protein
MCPVYRRVLPYKLVTLTSSPHQERPQGCCAPTPIRGHRLAAGAAGVGTKITRSHVCNAARFRNACQTSSAYYVLHCGLVLLIDMFRKHKLRHDKPFMCDVLGCKRVGQGFTTVNDLDRHKKSVHRVNVLAKSYQCASKTCRNKEKLWPRLDNFKQHIERMHKEEDYIDLIKRYRDRQT